MMFRRLVTTLPARPNTPGALTPLLPSRRPHLPSRLPRVLLLAAAGVLAGSGIAQAATPVAPVHSAQADPAHLSGSTPSVTTVSFTDGAPAGAVSSAGTTPSGTALTATHLSRPTAPAPSSATGAPPAESSCTAGEFCLWSQESYTGGTRHFDLRTANPSDCIPLPEGFESHSFVNHLTRDVTIYQGGDCSTEADFRTYPGDGTYVPRSPFVVRAIKIWE
ncbi:peptidase inhibitor family I36 protein [Amycolatopsis sp. PS_44_ISF1]|uniref:peptidase inhibitor family I36 protein n=1 Tax=Amycolatopsis sp. PS_44_ISF1 TaxID=2974917 RepID=UPI0037BFD8F1